MPACFQAPHETHAIHNPAAFLICSMSMTASKCILHLLTRMIPREPTPPVTIRQLLARFCCSHLKTYAMPTIHSPLCLWGSFILTRLHPLRCCLPRFHPDTTTLHVQRSSGHEQCTADPTPMKLTSDAFTFASGFPHVRLFLHGSPDAIYMHRLHTMPVVGCQCVWF